MKKLLHIIATPRGEESRTLRVTGAFLEVFKNSHRDWVIEELNLWKEQLPSLAQRTSAGRYTLLEGKDLFGDLKETWDEIIAHIDRFLSADAYLITTPMWNFSIPYVLKQYIDILVQPEYSFRYTADGIEGFARGRKMVIITSRGGEYVSPQTHDLDLQEPYLRVIFGFIGITDITFIIAQPTDLGEQRRLRTMEEAQTRARETASQF